MFCYIVLLAAKVTKILENFHISNKIINFAAKKHLS